MTNVEEAVQWLSYTYLFVRMRLNPLAYGLDYDEIQVSMGHFKMTIDYFSFIVLSELYTLIILV